jgi:hypothetical protein
MIGTSVHERSSHSVKRRPVSWKRCSLPDGIPLPSFSSYAISMATRKSVAIVAGAVIGVPFLALSILPYARRPTPKPNRPPPPLPAGVERVFTPQGLELYVARPIRPKREPEESSDFSATWWLWHGQRLERMDCILCIHRSHGLRSQPQWSVLCRSIPSSLFAR